MSSESAKTALVTTSRLTVALTAPQATLQTPKTTPKTRIGQISAQNQRLKLSTSVSSAGQREEANRGHETAQREIGKVRILTPCGFKISAGRVLSWDNLSRISGPVLEKTWFL